MLKKILLTIFCMVFINSTVWGWGRKGHNWILIESVDLLPQDAKLFYKQFETEFLKNVMEPDARKGGDDNEGSSHFINPELYMPFGFTLENIPWKQETVLKKTGKEKMLEYGILPWSITKTFNNLVTAIKNNDTATIIRYGADLAHYVGDCHQPLHLTANYNGQLTNNINVHFRFESDLVEERIHEIPKPLKQEMPIIKNIENFTFEQIKKINQFVPIIINADNIGVKETSSVLYDDKYFRAFWRETKNVLIDSFTDGAYALSSYYYTAYVNAFQISDKTKTSEKSKQHINKSEKKRK